MKVVVLEEKIQISTCLCWTPQSCTTVFPFAIPLMCVYIYIFKNIVYSMERERKRIRIFERYMDLKEAGVVFSQAEITLTSDFKTYFYLSSMCVCLLVISAI